MARYYFDSHDGDRMIGDDVGIELDGIEAVKALAARTLAELAADVLPGATKRELWIEVRTAEGPVMTASMTFEAKLHG